MKALNTYINEKLVLNKNTFKSPAYKYFPKTNSQLKNVLNEAIRLRKNDDVIDLNDIDTSEITDMNNAFSSYDKIKKIDISKWNVSNVINMEDMFYLCENLESIGDVSSWDVSKVKNMCCMFFANENINVDLSSWDVSKVENMDTMFYKCNKFDFSTIENWDVSNCYNMDDMFCDCKYMNADFSKWNTKSLTSMSEIFINCESFTGKGLEKWKTIYVTNMEDAFAGCKKLNCNLNNWNIDSLIKSDEAFLFCPKESIPDWYTGDI